MRVLVCAATEMEIAPTFQALSLNDQHTVDLLITGVGLMACTYALTKEVAVRRPDAVVQAGVGGALQPDDTLATVVAIGQDSIGDLGVQEDGFRSLFDLKLISPVTPPWQNGKLVNEGSLLKEAGLPVKNGVTVNEISTSEQRIHYYRNTLQAEVESMEGAALHYICLLEKIPFLQIRSLSNFTGERDKTKWQLDKAVVSLNHTLQNMLMKLEAL